MARLGFGHAVYLWRAERGLTQAVLARRARLPRPTISDLERGVLDPTLRTVRRVAGGLRVRPGLLVDGEPPPIPSARRLSRRTLERLVAALQGAPQTLDPFERQLTTLLKNICRNRLGVARGRRVGRGSSRRERRAWLALSNLLGRNELQSLMSRLDKRASVTP